MDERAFTALAERLRERLFWIAVRMLGDEAEAEEIVQETLIRLWRREDGETLRSPEAWTRTVAVRLCLDRLRRPRPFALEWDVALESPGASPEENLEWRRRHRRLMEGLMGLPPRRRAVAVLCLIEGLSAVDAARMLGISPSAARTHLQLAREELKRWT